MSKIADTNPLPLSPETYRSQLTYEQLTELLAPIHPARVAQTKKGNRVQSNMEAYDIRAELNRVFGFGNWDGLADKMELIREHVWPKQGKGDVLTVAYRCHYVLTVKATDGTPLATYSEWAMGDAQGFALNSFGDAHDFAMKTAESQALKRCAINLGDQFGLSLYAKGSVDTLVGWTLAQVVPPNRPVRDMPHDRDVRIVVPETDPDTVNDVHDEDVSQDPADHAPAAPPRDDTPAAPPAVSGPVLDPGEGPTWSAPEDVPTGKDGWLREFNRASTFGPHGFMKFTDWATSVNAPRPVLDAIPARLAKLNNPDQH